MWCALLKLDRRKVDAGRPASFPKVEFKFLHVTKYFLHVLPFQSSCQIKSGDDCAQLLKHESESLTQHPSSFQTGIGLVEHYKKVDSTDGNHSW